MLKPQKISKNQKAQKHTSCILQASGSKHNGEECLTVLLFLILVSRKPSLCQKIILNAFQYNQSLFSIFIKTSWFSYQEISFFSPLRLAVQRNFLYISSNKIPYLWSKMQYFQFHSRHSWEDKLITDVSDKLSNLIVLWKKCTAIISEVTSFHQGQLG